MPLPYYKRFPRDFLEGTVGMTLELKGAYGIVLDLIYMRDGRLEDDARYISGQLGCSVRAWNTIRESLIQRGKIQAENGIISNFRADYLVEEQRSFQDKQAENGSKPRKNKPLPKPKFKPKRNQSESESEVIGTVVPIKRGREKGSHEFPATWKPSQDIIDHGLAKGLTGDEVEREITHMTGYLFPNPRKDWDRVARNWLTTAASRKPRHATAADARAAATRENYRRSAAGADLASRFG